ncbi:MAG: hypothetical protein M0P13_00635 [Fibrobacteraceae bacterium]|nr:hypothetical protein [Fibrobacteraceae bacterium]
MASAPFIENRDDFREDNPQYRGNAKKWFEQEFSTQFGKETGAFAKTVVQEDSLFTRNYLIAEDSLSEKYTDALFWRNDDVIQNDSVPEKYLRFLFLRNDSLLHLNGLVICIHPIAISKKVIVTHDGKGYPSSTSFLRLRGFYSVVWMGEKKKLLAYGLFDKSHKVFLYMNKSDWDDVLIALVRQIVRGMPLEEKSEHWLF